MFCLGPAFLGNKQTISKCSLFWLVLSVVSKILLLSNWQQLHTTPTLSIDSKGSGFLRQSYRMITLIMMTTAHLSVFLRSWSFTSWFFAACINDLPSNPASETTDVRTLSKRRKRNAEPQYRRTYKGHFMGKKWSSLLALWSYTLMLLSYFSKGFK